MSYKKQGFQNRVLDNQGNVTQEGTTLKAEHLINIENAILELEKSISGGVGNLIDIASPTSASSCWSYDETSQVWTAIGSNYANLRWDIELTEVVTLKVNIQADIKSGDFLCTIRDSSNTTLQTIFLENGLNEISYTIGEAGTYSLRISGTSDNTSADISNISVTKEVSTESTGGTSSSSDIPEEFVEETVNVIAETLDSSDDIRILLFSDNHSYYKNKYKKYTTIMEQGVVDYSIGLGDYVDYSHIEKPLARAKLLQHINYAGRKPNQIYALGNHDVGICGVNAGTDSLDVMMSPKESFDIFCRHLKNNPNVHFNSEDPFGCYYYIDDMNSKTRLIILNMCDIFNHNPAEAKEDMTTKEYQDSAAFIRYYQQLHLSQQQLDWITKQALNFIDKEDITEWTVLLFGHWFNAFNSSSNNILASALEAAKKGEAITKSVTVSTRLTMSETGVYTKDIDTSITDTYTVDVDYSTQGPLEIVAFIYGHDHVDDHSESASGIHYCEVRCDTSDLDDFYITPGTQDIGQETYHFYSASGKLHTFTRTSSTPITDIGFIGYNNYWFRAGGTWPITIFDKDGLRKASISGVQTVTEVPEGSIEITGWVRERGDTLVGEESCEILCLNKKERTITFVPWGTATKRTFTY